MPFLTGRGSSVVPIVGATLLALCVTSRPSLAQQQILSGKDPVPLTPAQQAVVDKITRSPGTVSVGVMKPTGTEDRGSSEDRYAKVVLPLREGKDITLVRRRPTIKTERGFT